MHPFYDPSKKLLQEKDHWWVGLISMMMYLLFWGIVSRMLVRLLNKNLFQSDKLIRSENSAQKILSERYARGEINLETFREMEKNLQQNLK